jgi:crotonobetainyl-CoA:carnitine CoA-transferase CaiB-like acyl-CoA transferase
MTHEILTSVLASVGREAARDDEVTIRGGDPVLDTPFRVAEAAAAVLAGCGVEVADLWEMRTGRRQSVGIDVSAAAAALISFLHLRGSSPGDLLRLNPPTVGLFEAKGGDWIHLHGGFPHLHTGTLSLLGCADDRDSIAGAVATWDAQALEDALADRRLCAARVRSAREWAEHPQGRALAAKPLIEIRRIGDAPPAPLPGFPTGGSTIPQRPLSGLRVLDLTRVLAGPTCGRTLAEHGADVLRIGAPHLPSIQPFVVDTGHGKLSAHLDLREPEDAETLRALVRDAHVFSRGYRQGALEQHGFAVEDLAELRPGIVVVSINCYGHEGPWAQRAGWEQLAQSTSGIAVEQGAPGPPRLVPAAPTDYITGYLGALGVLAALARQWREGGSYEVRVSLTRSAMWLLELDRAAGEASGVGAEVLEKYSIETETAEGVIGHLGPILELSETPPRWSRPTVALGTHSAVWPD